jgi:hypothetical protein
LTNETDLNIPGFLNFPGCFFLLLYALFFLC